MRGAVVKEDGVRFHSVEGQADLLFGEERENPVAERGRKAKVTKDMNGSQDINVVEEAQNVRQNNRCHKSGLDGGLSIVNKTKGSIDSAMVIA